MEKIHFVGIGGVGMGSLAIALTQNGYDVTGSDGVLYDPMKSELLKEKIKLFEGYHSETVSKVNPDRVIIGNVVRKDNPEVVAWIQKGAPFISFPQAVRQYLIQDKKSVVVAGTHGKTTTTSWIAYLLQAAGLNPSYFIGGVPHDLPSGAKISDGDYFVGEGDEYDSAFFDKGPKFLHYNPECLVLTSVEFDHADIYRDLAHVRESFEKLIALLPGTGLCIARFEDPNVMKIIPEALCPVQTFGLSPGAMWKLGKVDESDRGFDFEVIYKNRSIGNFKTPLLGEHNLLNILSGIVVGVNLGISIDKIRPLVESFRGPKRRQEIHQGKSFLLVDDFAHHPTEVTATLKAVRGRFKGRKIFALFEPRSATARRNIHQTEYAKSFDSADEIIVSEPFNPQAVSLESRLSSEKLVQDLVAKGKRAKTYKTTEEILNFLRANLAPQDVIVVMSNGEFDKIQQKILEIEIA